MSGDRLHAGCARTPACRESGCGCGCQSIRPWIDSFDGSRRTHAQQEQRTLRLYFSQSLAVFSKVMVQGPTRLANVGARAFGTRDAVYHSFPVVCWYCVLGVHKLLPQGPERMKGNLDGYGGQDPTNGFGQFTDVGKSHRSTGLMETWSLLIRLWAGVLVYEAVGVTISLGLRHKLLLHYSTPSSSSVQLSVKDTGQDLRILAH